MGVKLSVYKNKAIGHSFQDLTTLAFEVWFRKVCGIQERNKQGSKGKVDLLEGLNPQNMLIYVLLLAP